jgi:acyl-CoA thioesterase I
MPVPASAEAPTYACADRGSVTRLSYPLAHMARRLASGGSITIVALGSSSTAGAGASGPGASYPSRLEAELKGRFPHQAITVLNRGVNGEEAADMMSRFDESVAAAHPDVVLWQVGTNAVLRDNPLGPVDRLVHDGIARIKAIGADVVLIDPQFAPKVIIKPDADEMVGLISAAAKQASVNSERCAFPSGSFSPAAIRTPSRRTRSGGCACVTIGHAAALPSRRVGEEVNTTAS